MSLNIGELVAYAKVDHTGVGRGIAAAQRDMRSGMDRLAGDAQGQGQKAGKAAGDGMATGFKGGVANLAKIAVGAFAVERVVTGLRTAVDAASDLNETTSMSAVIFGKQQAAMQAFAKAGPRALGLSTEATLRYSASLGDMLLQLGFAEDATVSQSKATLQLAADLGSFKNLGTEDVLDRITAALRGEYDSLQLLIPNINAARVEQEALAATGKDNAGALTAQEKATATLAIVQKDGARAAGDFARTADGAANAQKTSAATAQDLAAAFGQKLLPAYTAMVTFGRDEALPFLSEFIDYVDVAGDAVGPLVGGLGEVVGLFKDLPGPVQAATAALVVMVALRSRVEALGGSIQTGLGNAARGGRDAVDALRLGLMYAGESSETSAGRFTASARAIGTTAAAGIRGAATGLLGLLGGPWGLAFGGAIAILGTWMKRQADSRARVQSLTDSLDEQTGAITRNTREQVNNALDAAGALEAAGRAGLNVQDVFQSALGDPAALDRLNAAAERLLTTTNEYDIGGTIAKGAPAVAALRGDLEIVNEAVGQQATALDSARAAAERKAAVDVDGSAAQDDYGDSTEGMTKRLEEQRKALQDIAKLTLELSGAQVSATDAQIAYEAAIDAANAAAKENERTTRKGTNELNLSTEAGRANASALTALRDEAYTFLEAQAALGATTGELTTHMDGARDAFVAAATKMTGSKEAAEAMADKFGLSRTKVDELKTATDKLPTEKEIAIRLAAEAAKTELARLKALLDGLKSKTLVVDVKTGIRYVNDDPNRPGRATGGGQTFSSAEGNILRFANGTEDHRAFIAGRGTPTRVFNEPETGGEGYIPLANDRRRPRAVAITAAIADEFGYALSPKGQALAGASSGSSHQTNYHLAIAELRPANFGDFLAEAEERAARENQTGSF